MGTPIPPHPAPGSPLAVGRRISDVGRDRGGGLLGTFVRRSEIRPDDPDLLRRAAASRVAADVAAVRREAIANGMTYAPMTPEPIVPSGYAPMTPPQSRASFGPRAGGVTNPRAPGASSGSAKTAFVDDDNGNQTTLVARLRWRTEAFSWPASKQLALASGDMSAERRNYENAAKRRLRAAGFDA